jgi:putative hydrolase of the HAD superfamily
VRASSRTRGSSHGLASPAASIGFSDIGVLLTASPLFFFDLDDTLVDHSGAEETAQRAMHGRFAGFFGAVGFDVWLARYREVNLELWARYGRGEITRDELSGRRFKEPMRALGLDHERHAELWDWYRDAYRRSWTLVEGAKDILEHASRNGIVGILSNGFRETQRQKIGHFGLERWVRHVILSEDVGAMKPARAIFDAAWREAGGGENVRRVYVGDCFETDVVGAKNAGWLPILFDRRKRGASAPVIRVEKLADLRPLLS